MIHSRVLRLIATVVPLLAPGLASALCAGNDLRDTLPATLVEQASANLEASRTRSPTGSAGPTSCWWR